MYYQILTTNIERNVRRINILSLELKRKMAINSLEEHQFSSRLFMKKQFNRKSLWTKLLEFLLRLIQIHERKVW